MVRPSLPVLAPSPDPPRDTQPRQIQRRSRNACDACRARKVKVCECPRFIVDFLNIDQIPDFEPSLVPV